MDIADIDTELLIDICRLHDVTFLGIFGSFARGEATLDSDVDLIVRFAKRKSLLHLVGLERELSEACGRKVEVLTEAAISPYLRERIKAETVILYDE
jgi:predicted nucleotidyltransferase